MQPFEGALPFPVRQRNVDFEDANQAVRDILDPCRLPGCSPAHAGGDVDVGRRQNARENLTLSAGDGVQQAGEVVALLLAAKIAPVAGVELHVSRSDELLEGPSAREPSAQAKARMLLENVLSAHGLHVAKVGVTDLGLVVPAVHGVDGLG